MTNQTKYFIEPSDILALAFECTECKTLLSIPQLDQYQFAAQKLCPVCGNTWFTDPVGYPALQIRELAQALQTLIQEDIKKLAGDSTIGFFLKFEINTEAPKIE